MTQQNKELNSQLEELAKVNLDDNCKKQNYQLKNEVMKKDFEKLQRCCDSITIQRDKAKENLATISQNAEQNKRNYELCIKFLRNELCTKANDLSHSLEERDNLLEEISDKDKIIYNLNSKLQHEHEYFQQLEEKNLKCMVEKEAKFKQLHEDMICEVSEYKSSNGKLKTEISKLSKQNNYLILQLNEEISRFKIMEAEAISIKTLSKEIEEGLQSKILKIKRILFLARQRGKDFMLEKNYLQVRYDKMINKIHILENQLTILSCVGMVLWYFHAISKTKCEEFITKGSSMIKKIIIPIVKREIISSPKIGTMVNFQRDQVVLNENQIIFHLNLSLSKHIKNQVIIKLSVFPRIYCLQESEAHRKSNLKLLFCIQAKEGCLMKECEVKSNKLLVFCIWRHNYWINLKLINKTMSNLIEVHKKKPKLLKRTVLKRTIDLSMEREATLFVFGSGIEKKEKALGITTNMEPELKSSNMSDFMKDLENEHKITHEAFETSKYQPINLGTRDNLQIIQLYERIKGEEEAMWKKDNYIKKNTNVRNKISTFMYRNFQSVLEDVKKLIYSITIALNTIKVFINIKTSMIYLTKNGKTIINIGASRTTKVYGCYFSNIKQSKHAIHSKIHSVLFSNNAIALSGMMRSSFQVKIQQLSSDVKIWNPGIF